MGRKRRVPWDRCQHGSGARISGSCGFGDELHSLVRVAPIRAPFAREKTRAAQVLLMRFYQIDGWEITIARSRGGFCTKPGRTAGEEEKTGE